MNLDSISEEKIRQTLAQMGVTPEKLKSSVDKDKLSRILADPDAIQKLISTPEAQALLKKFGKG